MREMSDYVLAGRRMSSLTSALSASSSTTSGWTMLVFPALAFSEGTVHLWTMVGIVVGSWFAWPSLVVRILIAGRDRATGLALSGPLLAGVRWATQDLETISKY